MNNPTYFRVTRRDGSIGVTVGEVMKMSQWRAIINQAVEGTVYVDVHADYNVDVTYYSSSHTYSDKNGLKNILRNFKDKILLRYGISKIDGITVLHLDIVK